MNPESRKSTSIDDVNPISKEHHVDIPGASCNQSAMLNLPCRDLLYASREGDWKTAKDILDEHKELVRFSIIKNCETALHVAVSGRKTMFVKNLVRLMEKEDLELQEKSSYTALCIAVSTGDVDAANILLQKNKDLINIPTSLGMTPLQMAASSRKSEEMVQLLYKNSQSLEGDLWRPESRSCFLLSCVEADYFDVALKVLKDFPELALRGWDILKVLAQNRQAFDRHPTKSSVLALYQFHQIMPFRRCHLSQSHLLDKCPALQLLKSMLKSIAKLPWREVYDLMRGPADPINKDTTSTNPIDIPKKYSSRVLFLAAEVANNVFIVEIIRQYPELLNDVNDVNQSIFHVAVSHRYVKVYSLLNEIGSIKDHIITLEDGNGNNMLHLVGILTESLKSKCYDYSQGPAQLMQREIFWFKEVESMVPSSLRKKKNAAGMTPHEEFIKHHKYLVSDSEKWIKDTGSQLIVVAALVATISYAATITFPGGYNQETGYPVLSRNKILFLPFIIFNTLAFMSASVSMVFALSLHTLRYAEEDYISTIPKRLSTTIGTLIVAIYATAVAFMFNLFLLTDYMSPLLTKIPIGIIVCLILYMSYGLAIENVTTLFDMFYGGRISRYERDSMSSTRSPEQVLFQNI